MPIDIYRDRTLNITVTNSLLEDQQSLIKLLQLILPLQSQKNDLKKLEANILEEETALIPKAFLENQQIKFAKDYIDHEYNTLLSRLNENTRKCSPAFVSLAVTTITAASILTFLYFTTFTEIQNGGDQIKHAGMADAGYLDPLFSTYNQISNTCSTANQTANDKIYFNLDLDPHTSDPIFHTMPNVNKGFFQYFTCQFNRAKNPTPLSSGTLTAELHAFYGSNTQAKSHFENGGFLVSNATLEISDFGLTMQKAAQLLIAELLPAAASIPNGLYSESKNTFSEGLQSFGETFKSIGTVFSITYATYLVATAICLIGLAIYKGAAFLNHKKDEKLFEQLNQAKTLFHKIENPSQTPEQDGSDTDSIQVLPTHTTHNYGTLQ